MPEFACAISPWKPASVSSLPPLIDVYSMPALSSDAVSEASVPFAPGLSALMMPTVCALNCSFATPAMPAASVALPPVTNSALAV